MIGDLNRADGLNATSSTAAPDVVRFPDAGASSPTTSAQATTGRYELLDEIAHGGMGTVYRAIDRTLDREVAIKETAAFTQIRSTRDTVGSETQAGSVLGTPAYMPPEQAVGAIGQVDERADVFGLGAMLAVILTGQPPYAGGDLESVPVLAALGKVDDCYARLDVCGAEPDLVALCKQCLSTDPARPRDAGEVARAVANFRQAAEERARNAEIDRVRAEGEQAKAKAEARAQTQKRRTQQAVAAPAARRRYGRRRRIPGTPLRV